MPTNLSDSSTALELYPGGDAFSVPDPTVAFVGADGAIRVLLEVPDNADPRVVVIHPMKPGDEGEIAGRIRVDVTEMAPGAYRLTFRERFSLVGAPADRAQN